MVCFHMLSRLFSRLLLWQDYDLKFPAQIFASTEISTPSSESPISESPSSESPISCNLNQYQVRNVIKTHKK